MTKHIKILDSTASYRLAKEFWLTQLGEEIQPVQLIPDYLGQGGYAQGVYEFALGSELTTRLLQITRSQDLLIYITLLSTLSLELERYSGQEALTIGIPCYQQPESGGDSKVEPANSYLIYHTKLVDQGSLTFKGLMGKVKGELQEHYAHQHYPLEQIVADLGYEGSGLELVPVSLVMENLHSPQEIGTLSNAPTNQITLSFKRDGEKLQGKAIYNQHLLAVETVQRFVGHFLNLLENAIQKPDQELTSIPMLSDVEAAQIRGEFNQTDAPYPAEETLVKIFADQVTQTPEQVAVVQGEQALTYRELDQRAEVLAHKLQADGVTPNTIVGIMIERSVEMLVGIMAILKAGGAYLPISPDDPEERINFMLADAEAKLLLTRGELMEKVNFAGTILDLEDAKLYQSDETTPTRVINSSSPRDLAYVIYTSGTTGKPKGVMIEHHAAINRIHWMQKMYPAGPEDVILQKTTYTFDVSVWELFWWFFAGSTVCLLPHGGEKDPKVIAETIQEQQISIMHFVPSMLNLFLDHLEGLESVEGLATLKWVFTSGEALTLTQVERFNQSLYENNGTQLVNLYGPTEASIDVTYFNCSGGGKLERVPIGRPIDNIQLYIVDGANRLQPIGVPGELCITGVGLARGYLNRPQLTAEKFVANPFEQGEEEFTQKMYRTGDLARWLPDGNIEFLGRIDHQVKIRGFRIELGEIEHQISQIPGVKSNLVMARADESGNQYLCAYLVTEGELTISELRQHLAQGLPEYMIPEHFVSLAEMPLTSNGKINRKALPEPTGQISSGVEYVAPTTSTEEKLVKIWAELLKRDEIGVKDNFFALGGQSMKGAVLATRVQETFQVYLPLAELFDHPTIEELAHYIDQVAESMEVTIPRVEPREYYPAWPGQARLFTLQMVDPESVVYNMLSIYTLAGALDYPRLEAAFTKLIQRHETLRTYFDSVDDQVVMKILDQVPFQLEYGELASEAEIEQAAQNFARPFDLRQAPLLRAKLWKLAPEKHVLMFDLHHIITDGVGGVAFIQDLATYYAGQELPPLPVQYKDFAVWQEMEQASERVAQQGEYLVDLFSGELPVLNLPTDYPRPMVRSTEGSNAYLTIDADLTQRLRELALKNDSTLYMVALSAFYTLLYKYTGQEDIIVGSPAAGRPHRDLDEIIGLFINNIVMRNAPTGSKRFTDFLAEIKESSLQAVANQDYQFDQLVERLDLKKDLSRNPLFDVFFAFQNYDFAEVELDEVSITPYIYDKKIAKFDLLLFTYDQADQLELDLEYNTGLFKAETAERILRHYLNILTQIAQNPELTLGEIEMLSEAERTQILFDFNATDQEYPTGQPLHQVFEEQVRRTPDQIAVVAGEEQLTYRELNRQANRLARQLVKTGVGPETVVGIMLDKSCAMVVSLLAILKAGGAYLPIDPSYPQERILYMLENADAKLLITTRESRGQVPVTLLKNFASRKLEIVTTQPRGFIRQFDQLPIPDRSLIDLSKYQGKIGMASVTNCIGLQTTRGCPYQCVFCHKVWSKNHAFRSAENIYREVEYYYQRGVTHFEILDDCFNLNMENGKRFFELVIQNGLELQIFFPNGLRGDLLTPEYIDLMVEAGVVNINLSLETASPRLQKLVKKNLDLEKFKEVMEYIATAHPDVILELATMHGFPTETEAEAMQTLNFIKDIRWIHFPYIHILKVYPNTEMEELALQHGVAKEDIIKSVNLAYHEIPETLPFPKSFTRQYQAEFLNEYFLLPERLKAVLPVQMRLLSEEALVQKYNAYLPAEIQSLEDVLELAGITDLDLSVYRAEAKQRVVQIDKTIFDPEFSEAEFQANQAKGERKSEEQAPVSVQEMRQETASSFEEKPAGRRLLLLDLSQHFSSESMLYKVSEQPLGLIYLLTYLKEELGDQIDGRIYKSGVDFDSFAELRQLVQAYQPELIGIRSLSLYKEFFHETVALLKHWVPEASIVTGGPYSTSDYDSILKDPNVDLAVLGEGEYTFSELIQAMLEVDFTIPTVEVLNQIPGIAYAQPMGEEADHARDVIYLEEMLAELETAATATVEVGTSELAETNLDLPVSDQQLAYIMYTSGSTGKPKGVMVEHRQVNNCIAWMQAEFNLDQQAVVLQRTNLTFDPSVWEIFWPLFVGARVELLTIDQGKDAQYLIQLMQARQDLTMLYCPASMVTAMTYLLKEADAEPGSLKLPWFLIGAESISREVVNDFYRYLDGRIVNTYGPTECAINNTYYYLEREDTLPMVPIGKPIANNQIYILSADLTPQPINLPGEIYIAGKSVVRGYVNNREQTEARFLENPFGPGQLYRTGDLGRWLPDGNIEILGRTDYQVKIRGYRIELGEIETALLKHKSISESAVIVRDQAEDKPPVANCTECGISTEYPDLELDATDTCTTCTTWAEEAAVIQSYFQEPADLKKLIIQQNQEQETPYDCLLLYAGGLAAGYALYQLVEQGHRVLALTYDHGYFSQSERKYIKEITGKLGVDHLFLQHDQSDQILRESMHNAATVCKGCFFASSSLAAEYASQHNIPVVIGATLSRGQIIENKVYDLVKRGITEVAEMEAELAMIQKMNPDLNHSIFELIGISEINNGAIYDQVKMVDFYRYFDLTNAEMLEELYQRDDYWRTRKDYAIYSTKCPIKEVGDYFHLQEKGYHYYGSATAWEYRLGHLSKQNVQEDLTCHIPQQACDNFLSLIDYEPQEQLEDLETKYICAYLVAEEELSVSDLRSYLGKFVPEYMIPSYFVHLAEMPLTQEGKVDRKALPIPEGDMFTGAEYVAPRDEVEQMLAEVWQEVLGVAQVGIEDNFFDLGGDSIRAIRVISGAQRHGYKFEVKDLFANPRITDLSPKVTRKQLEVNQEPVVGEVPLLPIQQWFFAQQFTDQQHWNQSVMLYKKDGFDPELLHQLFTQLVTHHDALRMRFTAEAAGYTQWNRPVEGELFELQIFDYTDHIFDLAELDQDCVELQKSFNLTDGPLVKLGLFKTQAGDHLLIIVHHLVVDGISWRILFEDLALGYEQLLQGKEVQFQAKTNSYQDWGRYLVEYAQSSKLRQEASYWNQIEGTEIPPLPKDYQVASEQQVRKNTRSISMSLSPEETRELLTSAHKAYNTNMNDLLLTALGQAIRSWTGQEQVLVHLEGHGREQLTDEVDITRTVGWFTSQYPVILAVPSAADLDYQIKLVKEDLRRVPANGIGYGVLKYLTTGVLAAKLAPEISFNYLGQFDQDLKGEIFEFSQLSGGDNISPESETLYTLDINGMVAEGQLRFTFTYNGAEYQAATIEKVSGLFREHLVQLLHHCLNQEGTVFTPADYGNSQISLEELQGLEASLEEMLQTEAQPFGDELDDLFGEADAETAAGAGDETELADEDDIFADF